MYVRTTVDQWMQGLLAGKYKSATSARKSIAKTEWGERVKERARQCADQYFINPGSVKLSDVHKKGFRAVRPEVAYDPPATTPLKRIPDAAAFRTSHATARLTGLQQVARCCVDFLGVLQFAHQIYPEYDISNGLLLLEKVLTPALADFIQQADQVLADPHKAELSADAAPAIPPGVEPIEPKFTPEQEALFFKTQRPIDPFKKAAVQQA